MLALLIVTGCNPIRDINNKGTTPYFVQITSESKYQKDDNARFEYTLPAFNEKGEMKSITFSRADRPFRNEAFLRLNYSDKKGVCSWDEIQNNKIPPKAKEKLDALGRKL